MKIAKKNKKAPAEEQEDPRWPELSEAQTRLNKIQVVKEKFIEMNSEVMATWEEILQEESDASQTLRERYSKSVDLVGRRWNGMEAREYRKIDATTLREELDPKTAEAVLVVSLSVDLAAYDQAVAEGQISPDLRKRVEAKEYRIFSAKGKKK